MTPQLMELEKLDKLSEIKVLEKEAKADFTLLRELVSRETPRRNGTKYYSEVPCYRREM